MACRQTKDIAKIIRDTMKGLQSVTYDEEDVIHINLNFLDQPKDIEIPIAEVMQHVTSTGGFITYLQKKITKGIK